jgi:hypothetical protein
LNFDVSALGKSASNNPGSGAFPGISLEFPRKLKFPIPEFHRNSRELDFRSSGFVSAMLRWIYSGVSAAVRHSAHVQHGTLNFRYAAIMSAHTGAGFNQQHRKTKQKQNLKEDEVTASPPMFYL